MTAVGKGLIRIDFQREVMTQPTFLSLVFQSDELQQLLRPYEASARPPADQKVASIFDKVTRSINNYNLDSEPF